MLTVVSLFSGCLGFDLGFELTGGFRTVLAVEKELVCRSTIQANRPGVALLDDVSLVRGRDVHQTYGEVDVVIGGPPCQSFSTIGQRGSVEDDRGKMILEYLRVIREVRPRFFVMENVVGILSAKKDNEPLLPWLTWKFKRLGYHVGSWKLNAADYGSPQKRNRVIIVGSIDEAVGQPTPTSKRSTLREAIEDLEQDPGECGKFSPKLAKVLTLVPEGGDWRDLPPRIQKSAMGNATLSSGGLTAFYRRLHYDRPCPTLITSPTQRATTLCHPKHTRPLSVSEYQRVQGFPDSWRLSGSTAQKYRQLGNAVPVELGMAIGQVVAAAAV